MAGVAATLTFIVAILLGWFTGSWLAATLLVLLGTATILYRLKYPAFMDHPFMRKWFKKFALVMLALIVIFATISMIRKHQEQVASADTMSDTEANLINEAYDGLHDAGWGEVGKVTITDEKYGVGTAILPIVIDGMVSYVTLDILKTQTPQGEAVWVAGCGDKEFVRVVTQAPESSEDISFAKSILANGNTCPK